MASSARFLVFATLTANVFAFVTNFTGHSACPSSLYGLYWVETPSQACTTITAAYYGSWNRSSLDLKALSQYCTEPAWWIGPRAGVGTLFSDPQAALLASQLPPGGLAWVGLAVAGAPLAWSWGAGNASSYALTDATAWEGGNVPAPLAGHCAVLNSKGLLQPRPCVDRAGVQHIACSIPPCACTSGIPQQEGCSTAMYEATVGQALGGYTCAPLRDSLPILSFATLPSALSVEYTREEDEFASTLTPDLFKLLPFENATKARDIGCGIVLYNASDRDRQLHGIPFQRGDALLTFNYNLSSWSIVRNNMVSEHSRAFNGYQVTRKMQYLSAWFNCPLAEEGAAMAGYVPHLRHFVRPRTISAGPFHVCVILAQPRGGVRCWGGTSDAGATGAPGEDVLDVPRDLPPVSSLASNDNSVCVLFDGHTHIEPGVKCWGGRAQVLLPPRWTDTSSVPFSIAAGQGSMCYVSDVDAKLTCWPTTDTPISTPAFSDRDTIWGMSHGDATTCMVQGATLKVICWGYKYMKPPADLPPVFALAGGDEGGAMCAHLLGSGVVRCWDTAGYATFSEMTELTETEPASFLAYRNYRACVILARTGRPVCFDGIRRDFPGSETLPPLSALDLSCNGDCACGISALDGSVHCWGTLDTDDYGGPDPRDIPEDVRSARAVIPTGSVRASLQIVLRDADGNPTGKQQFVPLTLDLNHPMDVVGIDWSTPILWQSEKPFALDMLVRRDRAPRGTNASRMFELVAANSALAYPEITVWTQAAADAIPYPVPCVQHFIVSDYVIKCTSYDTPIYGTRVRWWTGAEFKTVAARRPGLPSLDAAVRISSPGQAAISIDMDSVLVQLSDALALPALDSTRVVAVRPGDELTLTGAHFGLNAALLPYAVPWWIPDRLGLLRSCIHLTWLASPPAYHDNSTACECNGMEDWLGEGELPLSSILAWNDTMIRMRVPPGEGIREVRLCVEGRGVDSAVSRPRSSASIYLVWEPPAFADVLPTAFLDYTDRDTPLAAVLQVRQSSGPAVAQSWGACFNGSSLLPSNSTPGRWMYATAVASEEYTSALHHCTSLTVLENSLGACWSTPSLVPLTRGGPRTTAGAGLPCTPALAPVPITPGQTALPPYLPAVPDRLLDPSFVVVPVPSPLPNAVLSVTYTVFTWDGDVRIRAAAALASTVVRRTPAVLRSVSPNPLLLGPEQGGNTSAGEMSVATSGRAVLTLTGLGLRTPEEIADPRNGLLGLLGNASTRVWIDDIPCEDVMVIRSREAPLGYVSCAYPAARALGGLHTVRMDMVGVSTVLDPSDGVSAGLYAACAERYYGLFAAEGHRVCLPCPEGARCAQGIGLAPIAQRGFYNLGLPPRLNRSADTDMERQSLADVLALGPSSCPEESGQSRAVACVVACEPQDACLGDNTCAEGYTSTAPAYRCASCAAGYYRSSGVCVQCPWLGLVSILLLLLVGLCLAAFMFVLSKSDVRMGTVGFLLEYLQLLSLLQGPSLPWPPAIRSFLSSLSILRVNLEVVGPECFSNISLTPEAKLWVVIMLPFAVVVIMLCLYWALAGLKSVWRGRRSSSDLWTHGPVVWRTALWCLGAMYLPVIQSCLEVYNCSPTEPADGFEYMNLVFEKCWVPGGLQARMIPWAQAGLVCVGAGFPLLTTLLFHKYSADITEDQVLRAAGIRPPPRISPRAHMLRLYFSPLYADYRPGHHWAALVKHARCALVCVCALMLNKSPPLLAASVAFVQQISLFVNVATLPLMTPRAGYRQALYELSRRLRTSLRRQGQPEARSAGSSSLRLHARLVQLAEKCRVQALHDLAQGRLVDEDGPARYEAVSTGVGWRTVLDWNLLVVQLQAQVILTALLSIMYTAGLDSVYVARGVPAVSTMFFLLQGLAAVHIGIAASWDGMLQVGTSVASWLHGGEGKAGESETEDEAFGELVLSELYDPVHDLPTRAHTAGLMLYLCCFRCCLVRAKARHMWDMRRTVNRTVPGLESAAPSVAEAAPDSEVGTTGPLSVSEWTRNPIDRGKGISASAPHSEEAHTQGQEAQGGTEVLKKDSRRAQAVAMLYETARGDVDNMHDGGSQKL